MATTFQLIDPSKKYQAYPQISLPNRKWPSRTLFAPPMWLSTDLRDGNQSLLSPMSLQQKMKMFSLLLSIGYKEIEVGFPSASQIEYDFIRKLIDENLIPESVTIQALSLARTDLIEKTIQALEGAKSATLHIYNATAPLFREVVYGKSKEDVLKMAVDAVSYARKYLASQKNSETNWQLEYSPETFCMTELDFAKEVCDAVTHEWGASPNNKIILNLPTTIEVATPNVFADQIEWMCEHLKYRDSTIISVHPHNDRGTGTACAELAMLAGAERVEGCLFGNGERTGNVCLVNLAINLWSQGIHPKLDFSNMAEIIGIYEESTKLQVGPRHPWAGELVFTAFSGSHQDAIKKGFAKQKMLTEMTPGNQTLWQVPYLPIDPSDLGKSYEAIIRVNAQSGKGGIAYLMEKDYGLNLPRLFQVEAASIVQTLADSTGNELTSEQIYELLNHEFINKKEPLSLLNYKINHHGTEEALQAEISFAQEVKWINGVGNGPLSAIVHAINSALNTNFSIAHYHEHDINSDLSKENAKAICYIQIANLDSFPSYGIGIHENITTASLNAVISAINRSIKIQQKLSFQAG